jgi:hypothetical protein
LHWHCIQSAAQSADPACPVKIPLCKTADAECTAENQPGHASNTGNEHSSRFSNGKTTENC